MIEKMKFENMTYLLRFPKDFDENKKYPVILFLHGAGSRGNDTTALEVNPFFEITSKYEDFPFVVYAPLCSENTWFDMFETLERFAQKISDEKFADKKKIYAMGPSMGGYGTWQIAMSLPDTFAAIVPVCGGGMYWNAGRLKNTPVWAFHGGKDGCVKCEESVKMVDAVNKCEGDARLTIYPENAHDAWSDTYKNYEVFKWLLSHEKKGITDYADGYSDSKKFG